MFAVFPVVLPIFALIFCGWLARRCGALGPHATREINRFVVYLALPALLFDIVANANWADIWQPAFIATFGLGMLSVFAIAVGAGLWRGKPLADAAIAGLNAAYANNGYMGFPLTLALFGPAALAPTFITVILTVCVLFAAALVLVEIGVHGGRQAGHRAVVNVLAALARNPLLVAPALGGLFLASGMTVPVAVNSFLKLLGAAAPPCALVALGLFLAEQGKAAARPALRATGALVALKLLVQPALTWLLAHRVFGLSGELAHIAVLLAALPTGTGPFMVAALYGREAQGTARVILLSVVASLVTLTAYLGHLR